MGIGAELGVTFDAGAVKISANGCLADPHNVAYGDSRTVLLIKANGEIDVLLWGSVDRQVLFFLFITT